jgi:hypothetical protein
VTIACGRAAGFADLNHRIRNSLSLADAAIPLLNEQLHALAEMGIDRKTAGGLTKDKSFGRDNSSGPLLPMDNRGPFDIATLAIFPEYVEFDAQELLRFVVPGAAGRTIK